jgi:ankyrin repeat protein
MWSSLNAAEAGDVDEVRRLSSDPRVDLEAIHEMKKCTALWMSASEGHDECLSILLDAGADSNAVDQDLYSNTPGYQAAKYGHHRCLSILIAAGADMSAANKNGSTPMIVAAANGNVDCLRALIDAGVDASQPDSNDDRKTPLFFATSEGHAACADLIRSCTSKPTKSAAAAAQEL